MFNVDEGHFGPIGQFGEFGAIFASKTCKKRTFAIFGARNGHFAPIFITLAQKSQSGPVQPKCPSEYIGDIIA